VARRVIAVPLLATLIAGCSGRDDNPFTGVWENAKEKVVVQQNGFGEARVLYFTMNRPFSWRLTDTGAIRMEFGESVARRAVMEGKQDENGSLVVSDQTGSTTLNRPALTGKPGRW
jgi:hypothetical protein